jgi:two-component system response regulator YesN
LNRMRCLIVDDEELIIQRLTLFFNNLSEAGSPFTLVGQAYSGDEGIDEAERLHPDIIITDIRMPGMDGISMIELLKDRMPNTAFIILTAYTDFNYAKRAIDNNVSDYIIKVPLNEAELLRSIKKAAAYLMNAKRKDEQLRKLDMSILKNRHRLFKQIFRELLNGEIMIDQAEEIALSYDMSLFQDRYCCLVMEMDQYVDFMNEYPMSDQNILKYGILNIIEETMQLYSQGFVFEMEQHRFVGFLKWTNAHSQMDSEQKSWEVGQMIVKNVRNYLKQSLSLGFSMPARGLSALTTSYTQALEACEEHYYSGTESITTYAMLQRGEEGNVQLARMKLNELLQSIGREYDGAELIKDSLRALRESAIKERLPRLQLISIFKEFMIAVRNRISQWKQELTEVDERLLVYMNLGEQIEFLEGYIIECQLVKDVPGRPAIAKAVEYIERHVTERLSLKVIAEHANLAPAYFSSLFKKEMNENLVDYMNRRKIELATELLKNRSYSNQEMCDAVGIMNEAYFCTLFKQKTGSTPGQYRKQLK